ncbi:hypothetical protein [Mycobacterium haemophilum]|uniref:hypothetical protein n=1 Tax=Mycobacterium haemophilum TaxID=29311 RepID=UPI000A9703C6|nr:hypothetical protein [Mycobacterium haemophilum]MCV7340621.1 hypothetical protein [Mycobacterium haemophilum DSM 44634]
MAIGGLPARDAADVIDSARNRQRIVDKTSERNGVSGTYSWCDRIHTTTVPPR